MPLTASEWHARFTLQAGWTASTRQYLFNLAGVSGAVHVLDVGCGTGVLSSEIVKMGIQHPVGIDINAQYIKLAADQVSKGKFTLSDAHHLPFKQDVFDICFCHYVLLWVTDPLEVLNQMKRVAKPGAAVLALAEPDYGGRIDYPPELEVINRWQSEGLLQLGADPHFGRRLKALFHQVGLTNIEVGVIGAQWKEPPSAQDLDSEWSVVQHDLGALGKENSEFLENSEELRDLDLQSWADGERVLFVPTFYAMGRVAG